MGLFNIVTTAAFVTLAMTSQALAAVSVPEPASMALLAVGAGGVILAKLRRRK